MVPTRRLNTLKKWFTYKITGNIYFCPTLYRHTQVHWAQQKPNSAPKKSNGGSKMRLWWMNIAFNLHSSSLQLSNCTMTTVALFGRVFWTVFTVISPFLHRHVQLEIPRPQSRRRPTFRKNENRAGNVNILLLHIK